VHIHLYITDDCNLCCKYCRNKPFSFPDIPSSASLPYEIDYTLPSDIIYDLDQLYAFLSQNPEITLTFIGGEPLLRCSLICEIMDNAPVSRFMIQTNGLLLHRLAPEYVNQFETILVSIDGDEVLTNYHRGKRTYQTLLENISHIYAGGFTGEIIARMTVTEKTNLFDSVLHLAHHAKITFSSIHWQIDANFYPDYQYRRFHDWVRTSYIPDLYHLIRCWVDAMHEGHVLRWYPLLVCTSDLLSNTQAHLRCGSGYANWSILPDGSITPCPIMVGMKNWYQGTIATTHLKEITPIPPFVGRCSTCEISTFCGGRCLYAAIVKPWPSEGVDMVCKTIFALHDGLTALLPEIQLLLQEGIITIEQFEHEKYNGCEIIP
jgi:putative peptide-modifying radical SAM enzyme